MACSSDGSPGVPWQRHGRACHSGRHDTCVSWSLGREQHNQSPYGGEHIHCMCTLRVIIENPCLECMQCIEGSSPLEAVKLLQK